MGVEALVFYTFGAIAVISAFFVVLQQRSIYSALSLIVCFCSIAVLFYQLGAHFIAAIQVIVYAGAIMVLFLFVVMLIDPESEFFSRDRIGWVSIVGLPLAAFLGFLLFWVLLPAEEVSAQAGDLSLASNGGISAIAESLFRDYLLPFEVTSVLILAAVLGAMVLAKRTD